MTARGVSVAAGVDRLVRSLGEYPSRLRDAYGSFGVAARVVRALAVLGADYLMWVCAAYTWLNTSAFARPLFTGPVVDLDAARVVAVGAWIWWWALRAALFAAGARGVLPVSVRDLVAPPAFGLDLTLEGAAETVGEAGA